MVAYFTNLDTKESIQQTTIPDFDNTELRGQNYSRSKSKHIWMINIVNIENRLDSAKNLIKRITRATAKWHYQSVGHPSTTQPISNTNYQCFTAQPKNVQLYGKFKKIKDVLNYDVMHDRPTTVDGMQSVYHTDSKSIQKSRSVIGKRRSKSGKYLSRLRKKKLVKGNLNPNFNIL